MLTLILKLLPGAILGALLMLGVEELRMSFAIADAIKTTKAEQVTICDGRVAQTANEINAAVNAMESAALEAARSISRTPIDKAELQDVCDAETSCRDRKRAPR